MSIQSVVNTNISSVTDPNGVGGELPSSVMAFDMGLSVTGAGNAQAFGSAVLVAGTEAVGAYQGDVKIGDRGGRRRLPGYYPHFCSGPRLDRQHPLRRNVVCWRRG